MRGFLAVLSVQLNMIESYNDIKDRPFRFTGIRSWRGEEKSSFCKVGYVGKRGG